MSKISWIGPTRKAKRSETRDALKHTVQEVPLMVRELDGGIVFWNRPAEVQYGWSRRQALGSISHHLLSTVFPCPLDEINRQLVESGAWEGELIHTMNDGHRVKVHSRWELQPSPRGEPKVVEVNRVQEVITPESAHLEGHVAKYLQQILAHWWWFVVPFALCLLGMWLLHSVADPHHVYPLME